jgi:hypothetical protein
LADHNDAPDPRTDITDLFVFQSPEGSAQSVLILNINHEASAPGEPFDPSASYEVKIDTDGDLVADIAFHILFAASSIAGHTATVYRSTGAAAQGSGPIGEVAVSNAPVSVDDEVRIAAVDGYRFFAGLRSDPWFADVDGVLDDFRFTGHDTFEHRNVFGIVLQVPNARLGTRAPIRMWARTTAPVHGKTTQIDQMGRPLINAVFNRADADQAMFNEAVGPRCLWGWRGPPTGGEPEGTTAGGRRNRAIAEAAGCRRFRRATETPFNMVLEARR